MLATKVSGFNPNSETVGNRTVPPGPNADGRLDAASIRAACDASLRRLQTPYIDVYQLHWCGQCPNESACLHHALHPASTTSALPNASTPPLDVRVSGRVHTPSWVYRRRLTGRTLECHQPPYGSSTHSHCLVHTRLRPWASLDRNFHSGRWFCGCPDALGGRSETQADRRSSGDWRGSGVISG